MAGPFCLIAGELYGVDIQKEKESVSSCNVRRISEKVTPQLAQYGRLEFGAACCGRRVVIAGGCSSSNTNLHVYQSYPDANGWRCAWENQSEMIFASGAAWAICAIIPGFSDQPSETEGRTR
jgi:hypothetical protein